MDREKIFVVVPVYNVESYLERCVDSILNQTYDNFELVLVDDGSPDNCPAICDRYAAEYENITVIHQENGGLSAARNAGIDYAFKNGNPEQDWINFIDSDDFVHPKYLEYLYRAAKETNVEISGCTRVETKTADFSISIRPTVKYINYLAEEYWVKCYGDATVAWGKIYRLYLFKNIRYPVGKINEDVFTTHKLVFQCDTVSFIAEKLYIYWQSENSIMRSPWSPQKLNAIEAFAEQKSYFSRHGFRKAYKTASYYYIRFCIFYLRAMEVNHYDKSAHKSLKKDMYSALFVYAKEFGIKKAFNIWFSQRIMHRIKKVINKNFFRRAASKIKRILMRK